MKTRNFTLLLTAFALGTCLAATVPAAEVTDPMGNAITLPESVEKIVSMSPSSTQFLIDLGLGEKIVACDTYSASDYADALAADLPAFDMMTPDNEQLVALAPDIIITTGMSYSGGEDVFAAVKEAGICVADIPSGSSLEEVKNNLLFIGQAVQAEDAAQEIVDAMDASLAEIAAIGETIPEEERKSVLYEISTPTPDYPSIYTAGSTSYIHEMIELIGAANAAGSEADAWVSLSEEACVALNPDVILTTDIYTENVVETLLSLSGWENVNAVVNEEVYLLDPNEINRPNQHLVSALLEMAEYIYPEAFADLVDPFEDAA